MKKYKRISFFMVLLAVVLLAAPSAAAFGEEINGFEVYYLDVGNLQLEHRTYEFDGTSEEFPPAMTSWLNEHHGTTGLEALLPDEMEITGYEIDGTTILLSFNSAYSEMSKTRELLVRAGVVRSFLQSENISAVQIEVDGSPLLDSKGAEIGPMNADTFIELTSANQDSYRYETFTLYFADESGKMLVPETRTVYYRRSIPTVRVALEQLAIGPLSEECYATIPAQTELISAVEEDDIVYVDFDEVFLSKTLENVEAETVIASVVNTVIHATEVSGVEISVNGESDLMFRDEISLYNFFSWNEEYLQ